MTLQSNLEAVGSALETVTGLRVQTKAGKANVPAAVVELAGIAAPVAHGGIQSLTVRVLLLVQLGDFRNALERIYAYADPGGATATSVFKCLLEYEDAGDIEFEGPALVEYGGQVYGGGVFTAQVFAS